MVRPRHGGSVRDRRRGRESGQPALDGQISPAVDPAWPVTIERVSTVAALRLQGPRNFVLRPEPPAGHAIDQAAPAPLPGAGRGPVRTQAGPRPAPGNSQDEAAFSLSSAS